MGIFLGQLASSGTLAYPPALHKMPLAFNPRVQEYWQQAILVARHQLGHYASPHEQWQRAIAILFALTSKRGINPIRGRGADNTRIIAHLRNERRLLVKFIDNTRILKALSIRQGKRSCIAANLGFTITIDALVAHNTQVDALVSRHFRYKRKWSRYQQDLSKYTSVSVWNEGANMPDRWHLSYTINTNIMPYISSNTLPDAAQIEQYVLQRMWPQVADYQRAFGTRAL